MALKMILMCSNLILNVGVNTTKNMGIHMTTNARPMTPNAGPMTPNVRQNFECPDFPG